MAQFPGTCQRNRHARTRTGKHPMKIVKLEDFHVDGGWDTYSFLKITTDEGVTGWSEFNESRRRAHRPGPARGRPHRRDVVRPVAADRGWAHITRHRGDRECLPRHQGQST